MAYMRAMLDPFIELRGDRLNGDDRSIVGGVGLLCGDPVAAIGQQRRPLLDGDRYHVYPEGLRKAQRIINLASRFKLPLITFVDTQGADPGLEAEEQGIGNAVANTLGYDGRGADPHSFGDNRGRRQRGGLGPRVVRPHHNAAVFDILAISLNRNIGGPYPDDHSLDREAASALMLTARDCLELGIIDQIAPEPEGGAHTDRQEAVRGIQVSIMKQMAQLSKMSESKLLKLRYKKFRQMGEKSEYSQRP